MTVRWNETPNGDWIALNAQLRRVVNELQALGLWTDPVRIGATFVWADASGRLRIKTTAPTSDTDGTVVGTQV